MAFTFLMWCKHCIKFCLILIVILCTISYYNTIIFKFPEAIPFYGSELKNPYRNWNNHGLLKANFHAHSIAWGGLTNGHNSVEDLQNHYTERGYHIAGVSNYHKIEKGVNQLINIPIYEHGINLFKSHRLAIGAKSVSYLDFLLWQSTSHKQQLVNDLKQRGALVAINHPNIRNSYTFDDLKSLNNYDFIEVLNHYCYSFDKWDHALKNGKLVWLMANDDTHDVRKEPTCQLFNLIDTKNKSDKEAVLQSLKRGEFIAVENKKGMNKLELIELKVKSDTIFYKFNNFVETVKVIANGEIVAIQDSEEGFYKIKSKENYVRFEAMNENERIFTNPVTRANRSFQASSPDFLPTILFRFNVLLLSALSLIILILPKSIFSVLKKVLASRFL